MIKQLATGLAATLALGMASAQAGVVTGGDTSLNIPGIATVDGTVQAGTDIDIVGNLAIDVNGGAEGDLLTITSNFDFCGLARCAGSDTTLLFTLPLMDGTELVGFELLSTVFTDTTTSVFGNVLRIAFTEQGFGPGSILSGRILYEDVAAVPLPGAAMLFLTAAAVAGGARARKTRAL